MTAYEIYNMFNKLDKPEYYEIAIQNNVGNIEGACKIIQDCFECDKQTAEEVITIMNKGIKPLTPEQRAHNQAVAREALNKPKCPTCSSTNIQKIGTGERAVSVATLGMFSNKINKSFKCKNCGYTW